MPKAIKAFNVNATTNVTVYTCPSFTCAKVFLGHCVVTGTTSSEVSLAIGSVKHEIKSGSGASTRSFNAGSSSTTSTAIGTVAPAEFFLAAGQTISVVCSSGSVVAQILVIEEVAS